MGFVVLLVVRWTGGSAWAQGFVVGLFVMSLGLLVQAFIQGQGLAHRYMGASAEEWTATELKKLGKDWQVIHDVYLGGHNVDHALFGPSRIYAVESKWVGRSADHRRLGYMAGQANHRARALERELHDRGVPRKVEPLVVAWGPGAPEIDAEDGIYFNPQRTRLVVGYDAKQWRTWIERSAVGSRVDRPAIEAVRAICAEGPLGQPESAGEERVR
jgi:hypothetical protein